MKFPQEDSQIARLTTREYWLSYWNDKSAQSVSESIFFSSLLTYFPKAPQRFIEIGGFPGTHSIYFRKFHNYDVTLLDFIIEKSVVQEGARLNGLSANDIHLIEGDLFSLPLPTKPYSVVFSAGFIEHFENPDPIFSKHVEYLERGGTLFISVPNFRGISGWIQKIFDAENYKAHSLVSMDLDYMKSRASEHQLEIKYLDYAGVPHAWLDHPEKVSRLSRLFVRGLSFVLQKMTFLKGKIFSPYIILIARKS